MKGALYQSGIFHTASAGRSPYDMDFVSEIWCVSSGVDPLQTEEIHRVFGAEKLPLVSESKSDF